MKQNKLYDKFIAAFFIGFILLCGIVLVMNSREGVKSLMAEGTIWDQRDQIENVLAESFPEKNRWINANGLLQKELGITANKKKDWFRSSDGSLSYAYDKQDRKTLMEHAQAVKELDAFLKEKEIPLLYVQLPCKVNGNEKLPPGARSYADENSDLLLQYLREYGVATLDIREEIREAKLEKGDLYFRTDHHWKPQTALWAAGCISRRMERLADWEHDDSLYAIDNYDVKTYKAQFLGSLGKKVGNWYAGTDDFDLITPRFPTSYDFIADSASGEIRRKGNFEEAMIVEDNLKKDYFTINTYVTYTGGDYRISKTANHTAPNDVSVLLIRDSFSCTLMPFLSVGMKELTAIDLRHYKEMDLFDNIKKGNYDLVIIAYNPSAASDIQFTFDKD